MSKCQYRDLADPDWECPFPPVSEPTKGGRYFCIFHAPEENKDVESFKSSLISLKDSIRGRFSGFVFPRGFDWPGGIQFGNHMNFSHAAFFCAQVFRQNFNIGINFNDAIFHDTVQFSTCSFGKKVKTLNTVFNSTHFKKGVSFYNCHFEHGAHFKEITSRGRLNMQKCTFRGDINLKLAKCVSININDCDISEDVTLRGATIEDTLSITHSNIEGEECDLTCMTVGQARQQTKSCSHFDRTQFHADVRLSASKFLSSVSFTETVFKNHVWFHGSRFNDRAGFRNTTFLDRVFFDHTAFSRVDFAGTVFLKGAQLSSIHPVYKSLRVNDLIHNGMIGIVAKYPGEDSEPIDSSNNEISIILDRCELTGPLSVLGYFSSLSFQRCILMGSIRAQASQKSNERVSEGPFFLSANSTEFHSTSLFVHPIVDRMEYCVITNKMILDNPNLTKAILRRITMDKVHFNQAVWPRRDRKGWGGALKNMPCLLEEAELYCDEHGQPLGCCEKSHEKKRHGNSRAIFAEIIGMYRDLASNYESRRHYGMAGHFKAAEYDLRRSDANTNLIDKLLLRLYRCVSSYGESIIKPLMGMLIVVFVPAFLYLYNGLPSKEPSDSAIELIDWNLALTLNPEVIADYFLKALPLSLTSCLPIRTEMTNAIPGCLHYLPSYQRILFAILTGSLIFSVRRKIKR